MTTTPSKDASASARLLFVSDKHRTLFVCRVTKRIPPQCSYWPPSHTHLAQTLIDVSAVDERSPRSKLPPLCEFMNKCKAVDEHTCEQILCNAAEKETAQLMAACTVTHARPVGVANDEHIARILSAHVQVALNTRDDLATSRVLLLANDHRAFAVLRKCAHTARLSMAQVGYSVRIYCEHAQTAFSHCARLRLGAKRNDLAIELAPYTPVYAHLHSIVSRVALLVENAHREEPLDGVQRLVDMICKSAGEFMPTDCRPAMMTWQQCFMDYAKRCWQNLAHAALLTTASPKLVSGARRRYAELGLRVGGHRRWYAYRAPRVASASAHRRHARVPARADHALHAVRRRTHVADNVRLLLVWCLFIAQPTCFSSPAMATPRIAIVEVDKKKRGGRALKDVNSTPPAPAHVTGAFLDLSTPVCRRHIDVEDSCSFDYGEQNGDDFHNKENATPKRPRVDCKNARIEFVGVQVTVPRPQAVRKNILLPMKVTATTDKFPNRKLTGQKNGRQVDNVKQSKITMFLK